MGNALCPAVIRVNEVWEVEEKVALENIQLDKLNKAKTIRNEAKLTESSLLAFFWNGSAIESSCR